MAKIIRITNLLNGTVSVGPYRIAKRSYVEDDLKKVQANNATMADILDQMNDGHISVKIDGVAVSYNELDESQYVPTSSFSLKGDISVAADFPTLAVVTKGDVHKIRADVTDDNATKTNTGLFFKASAEIVWDGTTWTPFGDQTGFVSVDSTPYAVQDLDGVVMVDTATIGAPSIVNLATAVDKAGKRVVIQDSTGDATAHNIAVTPHGAETINGVGGAVAIGSNYGSLSLISDGANWLLAEVSSAAVALNTAHRLGSGSDHANVAASTTAISQIVAMTKTIYVDNGRVDVYTEDGSISKPFKAIQSAINALAAAAPAYYATIEIAGGVYAENLVLENAGLKYVKFQGKGYVSINPVAGNALQSTANNANLFALHLSDIIFAKPVVITGSAAATCFNDVLWTNVRFVTGSSLTVTCVNNISMVDVYSEVAFVYSNVAWSYLEGGQLQGTFSFTMDDTATLPSGGKDGTILANGIFQSGTVSYAIGGTATYTVALNGCRWGSGAVTVPAGVSVLAYASYLRGVVTNNGAITLRSATMQGYVAGTGTLTLNQPASQYANDSGVVGTTVKDALDTLKPTVTQVNAATYDLLDADRVLHVDYTITAAVTNLRLMTAQCVDGRRIEIKDTGCGAGANNITVTTEGAEKIITNSLPGSDTFVFGVNGESYFFTARNGNWYVS